MIGEFGDFFDCSDSDSEEFDQEVRSKCKRCIRPLSVCLCKHIAQSVNTKARVLIIQHPNEIKRPLRTVPLLQAALTDCHVIRTRKVHNIDRPDIKAIIEDRPAYVLYPGEGAISCRQIPENSVIIAIDGTWRQARGMLTNSKGLARLPMCKVDYIPKTEYVIRTQPEEGFVSTLEAVSAALSATENDPNLHNILTGLIDSTILTF